MNHLIATLSAGDSANWEICKGAGLWGTPARVSHAKHAVEVARRGDRLFVWQSGAGLIASATLAGEPFEFRSEAEVPWPSPESYRYGIPIAEIQELQDERRRPPFDELGDRVQFVTPDELEQRLRSFGP